MVPRQRIGARRRRAPRRARLAAFAGGLAGLALTALMPAPFERAHALLVDALQRAAPREAGGAPLAVVDVDEASLARLGQWPWPRATLAALTDRLTEAGAATIAFDVVFAEPDRLSPEAAAAVLREAGAEVTLPPGLRGGDAAFAEALRRGPTVAGLILTPEGAATAPAPIAGFATVGPDPVTLLPDLGGAVANLPDLRAAAAGLGTVSLLPEADGVVRRVPLVGRAGDRVLPGLSVEALRVAQGAGAITLRTVEGPPPAMAELRVGAFAAPTDAEGRLWLHPSGLPDMPRLSAATVVLDAPAAWADAVAGRIVLVGTSAAGLRDIVVTPTGAGVPGVEVHAEAIDQIMAGAVLARPDWARGAERLLGALGVLAVVASLPVGGAAGGAVMAVLLTLGAAGGAWAAFGAGLVLDPIPPVLAVTAAFLSGATVLLLLTDRERRDVRRAFSLYLAPALVERLADDPAALRLSGEAREVTVLFCDLRDFSGLSEGMDPTALTALLNGFLTPMTDILLAHEATIDKYMGDAIMAFWNAPLDVADHRGKALRAALAMQAALDARGRGRPAGGRTRPLSMGIGLNTGACCVGNLGSAQRFAYSAIGDAVNVASRVEGLTRLYGVPALATAETVEGTAEATVEIDRVRVKGRHAPVTIHAVLGDAALAASPAFAALRAAQSDWLAAYRARDARGAAAAITRLSAMEPLAPARLVAMQRRRLRAMVERDPAADWDDVFEPDGKAPTA